MYGVPYGRPTGGEGTMPLLDVFWTMMWFFLWVLWFFLLFRVIMDIFRPRPGCPSRPATARQRTGPRRADRTVAPGLLAVDP